MPSQFLLYGSYGYMGDVIARLAVQRGLRPILAGRNPARVAAQAADLRLAHHTFALDDATALNQALSEAPVVLHCAGPYIYTYRPMVEACLRTGTHYLDITGEIPVYEGLAARDAEARGRGVMLLPGVGFDVVPTDCLAAHLKRRLPTATRLALAFTLEGGRGIPPGTANTIVEMSIHSGRRFRRNGQIVRAPLAEKSRLIDFGQGQPRRATRVSWGDIFMAYHSTGIPTIEDYFVVPSGARPLLILMTVLRPFLKVHVVRNYLKLALQRRLPPPTPAERARTTARVWGEVEDERGRKAVSRLYGPEPSVTWTALTALAAVEKVLAGQVRPGFQTPSLAFGPDFVLEEDGVTREDVA